MAIVQDLMGLGMSPQLASRLGNAVASVSGTGTTQTSAAPIKGGITLGTPTASNTAFMLDQTASQTRLFFFENLSSTLTALVFPPTSGTVNGGAANAALSVPPLTSAILIPVTGGGVVPQSWWAVLGVQTGGSALPTQVLNTVSTAPTSNNLALTGANISGGSSLVALNLTATLAAGATATLPTVAALVTALQSEGFNPLPGSSYELDIYNSSSGNFAWTTTTNTGWTLSGTAQTITQNTVRKYILTLTSLTAATLASIGEFTVTAAP